MNTTLSWATTSNPDRMAHMDDEDRIRLHHWRNRTAMGVLIVSAAFCLVVGLWFNERQEAARRNRDFTVQYAQLLEMTPTGLLIANADGEILAANDKAVKILGDKSVSGSHVHMLCPVILREKANAAFSAAVDEVRHGRQVKMTQIECRYGEGESAQLLQFQIRIVPAESGDPVVMASITPLSAVSKVEAISLPNP